MDDDRGRSDYLRRYTSLPVLLDMLAERRLTLVDPGGWTDKNDTAYLAAYKASKNLKCLVALCFTATSETFHHWNVFSPGPGGVCVEFERVSFLDECEGVDGLRHDAVRYREINELDREPPEVDELPFLKRYPYRDEVEYRLVYEDTLKKQRPWHLPFDLSSINKIYLSPWHPKALRDSTVRVLQSFPGCGEITIHRTTVLANARWKGHARALLADPIV